MVDSALGHPTIREAGVPIEITHDARFDRRGVIGLGDPAILQLGITPVAATGNAPPRGLHPLPSGRLAAIAREVRGLPKCRSPPLHEKGVDDTVMEPQEERAI